MYNVALFHVVIGPFRIKLHLVKVVLIILSKKNTDIFKVSQLNVPLYNELCKMVI